MTRRSRFWAVAAVVFSIVNLAGGLFAAGQGEPGHAGLHAAVAIGSYFVWRFVSARRARSISSASEPVTTATDHGFSDQLAQLEQSVDAVAIEVERIGEGQRFMTRFFTENGTARPAGEGAAELVQRSPPPVDESHH